MVRFLILFLTLFFMNACASIDINDTSFIKNGMSKEEVLTVFGDPQNRQFKEKNEAWQYCNTGFITDKYVLIWLYDDVVTGMNTYSNSTEQGFCSSFFKEIEWQNAPNYTLEVRNR